MKNNEQVDTLDRSTGKVLSTFGRAGHQVGRIYIRAYVGGGFQEQRVRGIEAGAEGSRQ